MLCAHLLRWKNRHLYQKRKNPVRSCNCVKEVADNYIVTKQPILIIFNRFILSSLLILVVDINYLLLVFSHFIKLSKV